MIHYANIATSPRLQRVLSALADGAEHTTREIITKADVCAVNTVISELRSNGFDITTRDHGINENGSHVYSYRWPKTQTQLSAFSGVQT